MVLDAAFVAGIPTRVAAGAEWLDANRPGWVDLVDLDNLDMAHPYYCLLGQLYEPYDAAPIERARLTGLGFWTTVPGTGELGRELAGQEYDLLDREWERLILARRAVSSRD